MSARANCEAASKQAPNLELLEGGAQGGHTDTQTQQSASMKVELQADAGPLETTTTTTTTTATKTTTTALAATSAKADSATVDASSFAANNKRAPPTEQIHAYKKRFLILALFCAHSAINSFQWIQYSSITNVIANYYGASNLQVNLTSLVYMVTYIPFIIQASLMLERVGLRRAVLWGCMGTCVGSLVKYLLGGSATMTSFWCVMFGQTLVALSQLYIISIPPLLAAVWFPDDQVSTATGVGVFGNQLGIALGFIVPPMVISDGGAGASNNNNNKELVARDLNSLAGAIFWLSLVIWLGSVALFEDKPPKPPGSASYHAAQQLSQEQAHRKQSVATGTGQLVPAPADHHQRGQDADRSCGATATEASPPPSGAANETFASIKGLCRDRDFRLLILSYGINVGCFYAVSTVLNQMVAARWPELLDLAGKMGLLIVVSGMAGSVMCGQLLDRTHAYKLIIVLIYLFSLVSMVLFTLVLRLFVHTWPLYLSSIVLGFFMTGYLPLGFEFAAEITYPHRANTPAGLLNLSAQIFGLVLTYSSSLMVDELGDLWANTFLTGCLAVGLLLTVIMKADLRRQKAVAEEQMRL